MTVGHDDAADRTGIPGDQHIRHHRGRFAGSANQGLTPGRGRQIRRHAEQRRNGANGLVKQGLQQKNRAAQNAQAAAARSCRMATAGRLRPSRYSMNAPPPVEI